MDDGLTNDEYDALGQIAVTTRTWRPSACIARNAKRLAGLKFVSYAKDGSLLLTDKGTQTLFVHSCINGLRAIASDPLAPLSAEVKMFLAKKGHLVPREQDGGFVLTQRGQESLADIEKTAR